MPHLSDPPKLQKGMLNFEVLCLKFSSSCSIGDESEDPVGQGKKFTL